MGTITAEKIIDDAWILLQDLGGVRWAAAEMLGWLNLGQREVVKLKPPAYVKNASVQMVSGTKQSAPAGANGEVAVVRNMGTGAVPGPAVTKISMAMLDALIPDWHTSGENEITKYYLTDPGDKYHFYVYPAQPATPAFLELVYPCIPADVALSTDPITLDDIHAPGLMDYLLFRSLSKETEAGSDARAGAYYTKFATPLTA